MFGQPDDQQNGAQSGTTPPQNPAMLDNVMPAAPPANPAQQSQPDPTFTPLPSDNSQQQPLMNQPMPPQPPSTQPGPMYQPPSDHTHHYQPPTTNDPYQQSATTPSFTDQNDSPAASNGVNQQKLLTLKKDAMHQLEGLVDKIDGDPEQIFRTTMMMIQANDNHELLGKALEAAKKIADDKKRAEALMDVVAEINYFSQAA